MHNVSAPLQEQLQKYHYTGVKLEEKRCYSYCASHKAQDRVTDNNLKRQIKNFVYLQIIRTNLSFSIYWQLVKRILANHPLFAIYIEFKISKI